MSILSELYEAKKVIYEKNIALIKEAGGDPEHPEKGFVDKLWFSFFNRHEYVLRIDDFSDAFYVAYDVEDEVNNYIADGVTTIDDMDGLVPGKYIDTSKNREICNTFLKEHPEYRIENQNSPDFLYTIVKNYPNHPYSIKIRSEIDDKAYSSYISDDKKIKDTIFHDIINGKSEDETELIKKNSHEAIVDDTIKMVADKLEKGVIPWADMGNTNMPRNALTGETYKGINAFRLAVCKQGLVSSKKIADSTWITLEQVNEYNDKVAIYNKEMASRGMENQGLKPIKPSIISKGIIIEGAHHETLFHSSEFINPPILLKTTVPDDAMKHIILPKGELVNTVVSDKLRMQLEITSQFIAAKTGHLEFAFSDKNMAGEYLECVKKNIETFENDFIIEPERRADELIQKAYEKAKNDKRGTDKAVETTKTKTEQTLC